MNKKVLVTATNFSQYCAQAKALLEDGGVTVVESRFGRPMSFEELKERVGDIDAVIAGVDTWNERVFSFAPKLRVIARFGAGVDNIDLEAARARNIKVTNAKGLNANAVAEMAVGLMLCALRNIPHLVTSLRNGNWDRFMAIEMRGRTVGFLGFGDIARRTAEKLSGFGIRMIAYDMYPDRERAKRLGVEMLSMEQVLRESDVVSLHIPSYPETYHIMGDAQFAAMKDGAYFINTARGALVDEAALARVLHSGKLTAAAIDVFEHEPIKPGDPLFQVENLIMTPHSSAETYETYTAVSLANAQAVLNVLNGREPQNWINQ